MNIIKLNEIKELTKDFYTRFQAGEFDISEEEQKIINEIKSLPLNTLGDIKNAKESARVLTFSADKVFLFKYLITKEDELDRRMQNG